VLGGTAGIGRAAALLLASEGASVVVQGRNLDSGEQLIDEIASSGGEAMFVVADIYDYASVDNVLAVCEGSFGGLDVVVASGGSFEPAPAEFLTIAPSSLGPVIESRLYHRLFAVHAAATRMRPYGYGNIITLTTDAGRTPTPLETLIGASAAAVNFLVRSVARELSRYGIRLNSVSVSLTKDTPSYGRHLRRLAEGESRGLAGVFSKLESRAAFGLCDPEDVASAILFLASPLSDKMTGVTLSLNGASSFPSYS
jgi:3-oxoacyl-[acyl-carrier protein] reductase